MPESVAEQLAHIDLFAGLSQEELQEIAHRCVIIMHPAGTRVAVQGGPPTGLNLVLRGSAIVEVHGSSRPELLPGSHFGEMSLLDGGSPSASITAGPDGLRTSVLSQLAFAPMLQSKPDVAQHIIKVLCGRLRNAEAKLAGVES